MNTCVQSYYLVSASLPFKVLVTSLILVILNIEAADQLNGTSQY